jgi:hypothetical protein
MGVNACSWAVEAGRDRADAHVLIGHACAFLDCYLLQEVDLHNNSLTGPLEAARWASMPALRSLDLSYNPIQVSTVGRLRLLRSSGVGQTS